MYQTDLMKDPDNLSRLAWACRRGMLELDVLLGNYLSEVYPSLLMADKLLFIRLLGAQDPELFAFIMGHEIPEDAALADMAGRIRKHAQSRI